MRLDDNRKSEMLQNLMQNAQARTNAFSKRLLISATTISIGLLIAVSAIIALTQNNAQIAYAIEAIGSEDEAKILIDDHMRTKDEMSDAAIYLSARPEMKLFITGSNIAKIEVSSLNEYLYIWDSRCDQSSGASWQYNNPLYYIGNFYDKRIALTFDEDFQDYAEIEYRWDAWRLYSWAKMDEDSRIAGKDIELPADLQSPEALELAAGLKSSAGHIQLSGCPSDLAQDEITINITDRNGDSISKVIQVNLSNNEKSQLVLTAKSVK